MSETRVDSISAARRGTRVVLMAIVVGAASGLVTWLFLTIDHLGVKLLWEELPAAFPTVPAKALAVGTVALMTLLAALVAKLYGDRPYDTGRAEESFNESGRMPYRTIIPGVAFSLLTLFSGAAVGPEGALTDTNGGLGTWIAERFGVEPVEMRVLTYAGVAGAFGAFFGVAPLGALLAIELISPRSATLSRPLLVAGLASASMAWVVYAVLGGGSLPLLLTFPSATEPQVTEYLTALALGVAGGVIGLVYGAVFQKLRAATAGLRQRPFIAALAGGGAVAAAALFAPVLMFSGQTEVGTIIETGATYGALVLIGLGIGKLLLSGWSLSTAYFGGPIFPLIFAGSCFGLAIHVLVPSVPEGVAVMAIISGMVSAAAAAPLSVTIFLALITSPALAPVIAIAGVAAYIVRQALAPTLPGIYRAAGKADTSGVAETA